MIVNHAITWFTLSALARALTYWLASCLPFSTAVGAAEKAFVAHCDAGHGLAWGYVAIAHKQMGQAVSWLPVSEFQPLRLYEHLPFIRSVGDDLDLVFYPTLHNMGSNMKAQV